MEPGSMEEAQCWHEERKLADAGHDRAERWWQCGDCDFDVNAVRAAADMRGVRRRLRGPRWVGPLATQSVMGRVVVRARTDGGELVL